MSTAGIKVSNVHADRVLPIPGDVVYTGHGQALIGLHITAHHGITAGSVFQQPHIAFACVEQTVPQRSKGQIEVQ
ncbi:hypothetical protein D3C85_1552290 [compost metagenome]